LANSAKAAMLLVSHPPSLQDTAWDFAKQLDITHKIWSDVIDLRRGKTGLDTDKTILNAIYRDKYQTSENDLDLERQQRERANAAAASASASASSSFISSIYSRFSTNPASDTDRRDNSELAENVVRDCKLLFDEHYKQAVVSLDQLENEFSQREAIDSLKSILNVMRGSV
jgi:hypothetical protein